MLDVKTLIIAITAVTLLSPLLYYLLHKSNSLVGGTIQWTYAAIFSAIGLCMVLFKGFAPDWIVDLGANTAFALSYAFGWSGMRLFVDLPPMNRTAGAIVLLQIPPTLWFQFIHPSESACSIVVALVIMVFCCLIAHDLFKGALAMKRPMRVYGSIVYAAQATAMAVRIVLLLVAPLDGPYFKWGFINEALFLWTIMFLFSLVASLLLMVSEKLQAEIMTLRGIVPICSHCKKVRDDSGFWQQVESYVSSHSEAEFTHGICPDCMKEVRKELEVLRVSRNSA